MGINNLNDDGRELCQNKLTAETVDSFEYLEAGPKKLVYK